MNDESKPDLDLGRRFLKRHPAPGRLLLCSVTGSHLYGFSSPDSDLDIKGIHLGPTRDLLGLGKPAKTHNRLEDFAGVECDLTTNEAGMALNRLLAGDGNMLERILSPFQLVDSVAVSELQALARAALSKAFFNHYAGFLRGMQREHERQDPPEAKALLYTFRVALTGVHLLTTGELCANLRALAPQYSLEGVLDLIALKQAAGEHAALSREDDARYRQRWPRLEEMLLEAREKSPLPSDAPNHDACEEWLIAQRLGALG